MEKAPERNDGWYLDREPEAVGRCCECGEPIYKGDDCYNVEGEILCEDCMNDKYRITA